MKHYYPNVPKLGNIAVTRHAQARMAELGITQEVFDKTLLEPNKPDIPDGQEILWREGNGIRIVILTKPVPDRGAKIVKSVYKIKPQAKAK